MATNIMDRVKALMSRAVHASTPLEEARTCALMACQLIDKHGIKFAEEEKKVEQTAIDPYEESWNHPVSSNEVVNEDGFVEMPLFRVMITQKDGTCKLCNKIYRKSEIIAYEMKRKEGTHYKCRRYWTQNI